MIVNILTIVIGVVLLVVSVLGISYAKKASAHGTDLRLQGEYAAADRSFVNAQQWAKLSIACSKALVVLLLLTALVKAFS